MNQKELAYQSAVDGKANSNHNHSASNITSGTLPLTRGGTGVTSLSSLKSLLGISSSGGGSLPYNVTWTSKFNKSVTVNVPSTTEAYETVTTNIGYLKKSDDFDLLYMQVLNVTATYSGSGELLLIECGIVKPDRGSSDYTVRFLPAINFRVLSGTQVLSQASSLYIGFRSDYGYSSRTPKTSLDRYSPAGDATGTGTTISESGNGTLLNAGVYLSSNRLSGNIKVTMTVRVSTGKIR